MSLINKSLGEQLTQDGIDRAVNHANAVYDDWFDRAFIALKHFISKADKKTFMCEEVREFAEINDLVEPAPSERAWGGVMRHAAKENLIKSLGFSRKNKPEAHRTVAVLWEVC